MFSSGRPVFISFSVSQALVEFDMISPVLPQLSDLAVMPASLASLVILYSFLSVVVVGAEALKLNACYTVDLCMLIISL